MLPRKHYNQNRKERPWSLGDMKSTAGNCSWSPEGGGNPRSLIPAPTCQVPTVRPCLLVRGSSLWEGALGRSYGFVLGWTLESAPWRHRNRTGTHELEAMPFAVVGKESGCPYPCCPRQDMKLCGCKRFCRPASLADAALVNGGPRFLSLGSSLGAIKWLPCRAWPPAVKLLPFALPDGPRFLSLWEAARLPLPAYL